MKRKSRSNFAGLRILKGAIHLSAIASLYTVGLLSTFSRPAQAADQFDTSGIQFDVDTVVEFEFVQSRGAYQSTFGVINLNTGQKTPLIAEVKPSDVPQDVNTPTDYTRSSSKPDFVGTPGNTVPQPLAEFEFKANQPYTFYLESSYNGRPVGIVYSTNTQNRSGNQQAVFEGEVFGLGNGGTVNLWDDTGSALVKPQQQDRDFNDFTVRAGGHLATPCEVSAASRKQQSKGGIYNLAAGTKCTRK